MIVHTGQGHKIFSPAEERSASMKMTPEYCLLFNGITDAIRDLERMNEKLMRLQQQAEELYCAQDEKNSSPDLSISF